MAFCGTTTQGVQSVRLGVRAWGRRQPGSEGSGSPPMGVLSVFGGAGSVGARLAGARLMTRLLGTSPRAVTGTKHPGTSHRVEMYTGPKLLE